MYLLALPFFTSLVFLVYSYFWIDHGLLTFISTTRPILGNLFQLIEFTGNNKIIMAQSYLLLIGLMLLWQLIFLIPNVYKTLNLKTAFFILALITLIYSLSYPFLSKDIFYYYISAKMAYIYHLNPFTTPPIEIVDRDFFVLVSHNIRAPYLYGPLFLLYSIIPMAILGGQKIITYFIAFKLLNGMLFFISGLLLFRLTNYDRRLFSIWFLNPLLLIEWLANSHNDIIMIAPVAAGIFYLMKKDYLKSFGLIVISFLIKFVSIFTLPIYILNNKLRVHYFKAVGLLLPLLIYLSKITIQPWYLSWSYMFLPLGKLKTASLTLFSLIGFISLANYYYFLESSGWGAGLIIPRPLLITIFILFSIFAIEYWSSLKQLLWQLWSIFKTRLKGNL